MLATLWSSPSATNAEIGKKMAQNFPAASLALTDIQTEMRTRWTVVGGGLRSTTKRALLLYMRVVGFTHSLSAEAPRTGVRQPAIDTFRRLLPRCLEKMYKQKQR